jgi:hypothetical protein
MQGYAVMEKKNNFFQDELTAGEFLYYNDDIQELLGVLDVFCYLKPPPFQVQVSPLKNTG